MYSFIKNGKTFSNYSEGDIASLVSDGLLTQIEADEIINNATAENEIFAKQQLIRKKITASAGDQPALLGTTSDAIQFLLVEIAKLSAALASAITLAEVRAAAEPLNELLASFATNVADGSVKMPYAVKGGFSAIQPDIEQRATAVADVLIEASNA